MPCDVLQKDDGGTYLLNNSIDSGPQVSRIVASKTSTGLAERLARVARTDDVHEATPRVTVERLGIAPQSSRRKAAFFHRLHQSRAGERFPLHVTDDASTRNGQLEAKLEPAPAGADREDGELVGT